MIQCLRGLYAKHLGKQSTLANALQKGGATTRYLLHLDRSADVDGFFAFIELLFHPIIWVKPIALELGGRAAPASAWVTGAEVASGVVKNRQDIIWIAETEDKGGRNTRTEETVEFRYFLSLTPTGFFWGTGVSHELLGA